jgi:hypothetical protein
VTGNLSRYTGVIKRKIQKLLSRIKYQVFQIVARRCTDNCYISQWKTTPGADICICIWTWFCLDLKLIPHVIKKVVIIFHVLCKPSTVLPITDMIRHSDSCRDFTTIEYYSISFNKVQIRKHLRLTPLHPSW